MAQNPNELEPFNYNRPHVEYGRYADHAPGIYLVLRIHSFHTSSFGHNYPEFTAAFLLADRGSLDTIETFIVLHIRELLSTHQGNSWYVYYYAASKTVGKL